ncbi:MAG: UDP-glucose 4-epimerase GalE [Actinomycetota bacterium]|nr:UDP-glucose 4-epimerase GalE [Actinomycetota bacterium]
MSDGAVLVTGGAGYIGSHTVQALRRAERSVVVLDSLEFGTAEAVGDVPLVVGDIADETVVADTCRQHGVTQVVHFAAYKSVGESMERPTRYWHNNVANTVRLIDVARRAGADQFVFSSSCSVYGTPATVPVDETAPIAPESVYAETKATVERILSWYAATDGVRSVSLRYFNAAGASLDGSIGEDWTVALNLVPLVMKSMLVGEPRLTVYGTDYDTPDGTCIRDYIHVDDLAEAHVKALDVLAEGTAPERATAVNVGTGTGSSVLEVIAATERITGRDVPYELGARRLGDPTATFADPTRAKALLDWTPRHGLDEIIRTAYAWHSQ